MSNASAAGSIEAKAAAPGSISTTRPVAYHAVAIEELEQIRKSGRALPLIVAGVFAGAFLGTLVPAYGAVNFALTGNGDFGLRELAFLVVCAISLGVSVTAAIVALIGKSKVQKALDAIRSRVPVEVPLGHPAAPPPV